MRISSPVGFASLLIIILGSKSFADDEISHRTVRSLSSSRYEPILTEHFIIRHDNPEWAREVATHIELALRDNYEKWFPDKPRQTWQSRCEVLLYNNPLDYQRKTGQGQGSPGHSRCIKDSSKNIVCREISLRNCDPQTQANIRKHEILHVLLGGSNPNAFPRWADEGMAVLSEDISMAHAHLRNLSRDSSKPNYSAKELIHMDDYPRDNRWPTFYSGSVALTLMMTDLLRPIEPTPQKTSSNIVGQLFNPPPKPTPPEKFTPEEANKSVQNFAKAMEISIDRQKRSAFLKFIETHLNDKRSYKKALGEVYGLTEDDLEANYQIYLNAIRKQFPAPQ